MADTNIDRLNKSLETERRRAQNAVNAMRAEMERMAQQIEEISLKRAGIGMALEIFLSHARD